MNIYSLITPEILEYSVGIPNNFDKDDSHAKKLKINSVLIKQIWQLKIKFIKKTKIKL